LKVFAISLLILLALPLLPASAADLKIYPPGQAPQIGLVSQSLNSTVLPQKVTYDPATVNGLRQDLGKFSVVTSLSTISWNVSKTDYLQFNPPTVGPTVLSNVAIYYNSSETVWQMTTGLNTVAVYVKPNGYSANVFIQANLASAQTVCLPFKATSIMVQGKGPTGLLLPYINSGNEVFSWSDIAATYSPIWSINKLCVNLPIGLTLIDPLALDGSGFNGGFSGSTASVTLTTGSSPDVIIVFAKAEISSPPTVSSVTASGLTFYHRASITYSNFHNVEEWYAVASGNLSSVSITVTFSGTQNYGVVLAFGISGANTGNCSSGGVTCFDPNVSLPATSASSTPSVTTTNANDFIFGGLATGNNAGAGTGFTCINNCGNNYWDGEYVIESTTQSGLAITYASNQYQGAIGDAIEAANAVVTQGIQITTANGAPSATITISGCAASNGTFTANGNVHTYSGMTASCTVTLNVDVLCTVTGHYCFDKSPHPTASPSVTFQTCASGTCSNYQNTTYLLLLNTYTITPLTPTTWDGAYKAQGCGSYLGSSSICIAGNCNTAENAGALNCSYEMNYDTAVTIGSTHGANQIGNTWFASPAGSNIETPITGGNTYVMDFVQSTGGGSPAGLSILAIGAAGFVFLTARRRKVDAN
jgi:hypothetical protein